MSLQPPDFPQSIAQSSDAMNSDSSVHDIERPPSGVLPLRCQTILAQIINFFSMTVDDGVLNLVVDEETLRVIEPHLEEKVRYCYDAKAELLCVQRRSWLRQVIPHHTFGLLRDIFKSKPESFHGHARVNSNLTYFGFRGEQRRDRRTPDLLLRWNHPTRSLVPVFVLEVALSREYPDVKKAIDHWMRGSTTRVAVLLKLVEETGFSFNPPVSELENADRVALNRSFVTKAENMSPFGPIVCDGRIWFGRLSGFVETYVKVKRADVHCIEQEGERVYFLEDGNPNPTAPPLRIHMCQLIKHECIGPDDVLEIKWEDIHHQITEAIWECARDRYYRWIFTGAKPGLVTHEELDGFSDEES
ncbi:hypothetical protein JAAARDRAFT_208068 [Jaapia argillacea MUCL 33604]|uniref:Uncharacterized protein n=1 Tax=Jaapia argillacea MUCL 33604 TaxID=933084 RepID=A0A067PRC9_9AGAM|nr:hypothetical protein JAAARDRAFT_208068 [Jaapia argillacea MUCL 33604]